MRLAIIVAAAPSKTAMPSLGERDLILVRDRLGLEDLGFHVCVADPSEDLAEQLGGLLEAHGSEAIDVLLYASALVAVADEDECFLCLDADQPDVGDSLRDLADELYEHGAPRAMIVVDARYHADFGLDDAQMAEYVLGAIVTSVDCERTGLEVISAARPVGVHDERIPSRLTAGLLEAIDGCEVPLAAEECFATVRRLTDFGPWPSASIHVPGAEPFVLAYDDQQRAELEAQIPAPAALPVEAAAEPAAPVEEPAAEPKRPDRFPERRPAPPSERVEVASIGVHERRAALPERDSNQLPKVILSPSLAPPPRPKAEPPPPPKHRRRRSRRSSMRALPPTDAELAAARQHPEPHPALAQQASSAPVTPTLSTPAAHAPPAVPPSAESAPPAPELAPTGEVPAERPDPAEAASPQPLPSTPAPAGLPPSVPPETAPASQPPPAEPVPLVTEAAAAVGAASPETSSFDEDAAEPAGEPAPTAAERDGEVLPEEDVDVALDLEAEDADPAAPIELRRPAADEEVDVDVDVGDVDAEQAELASAQPPPVSETDSPEIETAPVEEAELAAAYFAAEAEDAAEAAEPPAVSEPPAVASVPPVAPSEPPAATSEPPAAPSVPPAAASEPPAAMSEPPAAMSEPPAAAASEPPAAMSEPPAASAPPAAMSEPPAAMSEPPATGASVPPSPRSQPPGRAPGDMSADEWLLEGNLAVERGDLAGALKFYKKGLGKLGTQTVPLRAEIYVRVADVVRQQGKPRIAISNYDKALAIEPSDLRALLGSIELNAEQGSWRAVRTTENRYFQLLDNPAAQYAQMMASGARWLDDGEDADLAKRRFEAARDALPERAEPLERLLAIYEQEKDFDAALKTRHQLLALVTDPGAKADGYHELARWCMAEARLADEANEAFELALVANPSRLDVLEELAAALADNQEWAELERIYRKMVSLIESMDSEAHLGRVIAEIQHRLALLYRDHLEDSQSALNAMDKALRNNPGNLPGQLLAADLAEELAEPERAFAFLGRAARIEPQRAETYHRIYEVAQDIDHAEMGFLASSVTTLLDAQSDDEQITFHKFRPDPVPKHVQMLGPEGWDLLRDSHADHSVADVMRALAPPVLRMRISQLEAEGKLPELPTDAQHDPESSTIQAVRSIGWASKLLGAPTPTIYVNEELEGSLVAPPTSDHAVMAAGGALRGRSLGQLAFLAGRHLALRVPEHELAAHLRSVEELTAYFLAALDLVLDTGPGSGDVGATVNQLHQLLAQTITDEEREELWHAVRQFEDAGGRVSLTEWLGSAERLATRAGFLLCGDLDTAATVIRDPKEAAFLSAELRLEDLCAFAVSVENVQLREMLGCTISGED